MKTLAVSMVFVSILLAGCASIFNGSTQVIPIFSTPDDASVVITDENGVQVFDGSTPTSVPLAKSDGSYWGGKNYTVKISKPGYKAQEIPISSVPSLWYVGGNILVGGFIGWFVVDPFFGGMYILQPERLLSTHPDKEQHNNRAFHESIAIKLNQEE